jgi:hypothetical protein
MSSFFITAQHRQRPVGTPHSAQDQLLKMILRTLLVLPAASNAWR